MIELLILFVSVKIIIEFVRKSNRQLEHRSLVRTWNGLTPEQRAQVVGYYNQMKSEGRI